MSREVGDCVQTRVITPKALLSNSLKEGAMCNYLEETQHRHRHTYGEIVMQLMGSSVDRGSASDRVVIVVVARAPRTILEEKSRRGCEGQRPASSSNTGAR